MTRAWARELAGWTAAAAVSLITAATVAASGRAELMFRDGDSLIVALVARSLLSAEKLDWAMSSVLFLPESAGFAALDAALPLGVNSLFAVSGALNLLALYGAIRLVAGRSRPGSAPVAWSLIALAAFGALAMTETSPSRDALELASLQLTTTYYSATVVAVILAVGIMRRMLDRRARGVGLAVALGAVALVSTLTNPLFAVWATVPLMFVLCVAALLDAGRRVRILTSSAILVGATGLGFLARIPFAAWIANTGAGYAKPELWLESITYYGGLLADRLSTAPCVLASLMTLALVALAVVRTVRAPDVGSRLVAVMAWVMPLLVVVGAIALGTHAARYLQPVVFAPLLALVAAPRVVTFPVRLRRGAAAAAGALLLVGGCLSIPRLADAAQQSDSDLACITEWVDASGRIGAGQFWTVRLPKLHLDDPSQLVQVDHRLNGYAWLVNRTDFEVGEVSFLVEDSQTVQWDLPESAVPDRVIDCGRYSILDFGAASLPLGPAHS
ncbi:hypothetical protein [Microbacterium sp. Leaf320]|uniref:hypothetical protein n=1 Tax=Microbacterium sp. Leaf320 TaxID=1736334 RepID=UPI0007010739|nr:hypothetical protein [Microbacterium sp. Leaf320]KQQ67006.1 hypothetical protein ASF63_07125 [Microbacterium sp. Leaf320]